jgi:hypothetical protein
MQVVQVVQVVQEHQLLQALLELLVRQVVQVPQAQAAVAVAVEQFWLYQIQLLVQSAIIQMQVYLVLFQHQQVPHTFLSTHKGEEMDYGLNTEQKRATLTSSLANIKSEIYHTLLRSNIDPDIFNPDSYEIEDVLIGERERLETFLKILELIERKLSELT